MTTIFRTLMLLGFTGLMASASGCIIETTSDPGTGSSSCASSRYFIVQWGVDHGAGTVPLSCNSLMSTSYFLQLTTDAPNPYDLLAVTTSTCDDTQVCSDNSPCNVLGTTGSGVPAGTHIISADLMDNSGAILSSADGPNLGMPSCQALIVGFPFTIR